MTCLTAHDIPVQGTAVLRPGKVRGQLANLTDWGDGEPDTTPRHRGPNPLEAIILRLIQGPPMSLTAILLEIPDCYDAAVVQAALWWLHLEGKLELHASQVRRREVGP